MRNFSVYFLFTIGLFTSYPGFSADVETGRSRAATCTACHGYKGISANDEWPNLAGQKTGYLIKQIKAFRDGNRYDPLMSTMATGLSDEDIENIATYLNQLK